MCVCVCGVCADVDECALGLSECSHDCTNTPGGYFCECDPGYELNANGLTCDGE